MKPKRFARAVRWSVELHDGQARTGTGAPYVAHPLGVAALVLDHGGTEAEAIAALLHDVVEDADVTLDDVQERFGATVARIVEGCTDVPARRATPTRDRRGRRNGGDGRDGHAGDAGDADRSAATWWKRKRRVVRQLADPATSESVLRVKAADLLWNARALSTELRHRGPEVWRGFHAGAIDQLWYFRSASTVITQRLPGRLADELRVAVGDLERLAGWWFDVGDPQDGTPPEGTRTGRS